MPGYSAEKLDSLNKFIKGSKPFHNGSFRAGVIQLNGVNPTHVNFKADSAASKVLTGAPWDMHDPGNGGTVKMTFDGGAEKTATVNAAAGTSVSGASPSTDISAGSNTNFKISVDGDTAETVTLTLTGLTSGAAIATEMQAKIRALGGNKAAVTVAYTTVYTITSSKLGTGSHVVITDGSTASVAAALKIGAANGGTETAGTGDCADIKAVTAAELAAVLTTDFASVTGISIVAGASSVTITSPTEGRTSKIATGNGTLNTVLSLTNGTYETGGIGLGYDKDMADASYVVSINQELTGEETHSTDTYAYGNKTVSGFDIKVASGSAASTNHIGLGIISYSANPQNEA